MNLLCLVPACHLHVLGARLSHPRALCQPVTSTSTQGWGQWLILPQGVKGCLEGIPLWQDIPPGTAELACSVHQRVQFRTFSPHLD